MPNWVSYRDRFGQIKHERATKPMCEGDFHALSSSECQNLKTAALECRLNPYNPDEREQFILTAQKALDQVLTKGTRARIVDTLADGFGAICVTNLPVDDDLPDTPTKGGNLPNLYKTTFVTEFVSIVLGQVVQAEPFNFRQEGLGSSPLIDNIVPVQSLKEQKGAGGYDNNFPFHSESAWHRLRPDYLVLNGLRGDPSAQTLLFSVHSLNAAKDHLDSMPQTGHFRLAAPQLYRQMEDQGMPMGTDEFAFKDPVALDDNGHLTLNINFNGTDCATEVAAIWLQDMEAFIEANAYSVVLDTGTALIANNDRTCHTRSGYTPTFNGKQRWFQRTYFQRDLWRAGNKPRQDSQAGQKLLKSGWINNRSELTSIFGEFINDNPDLSCLSVGIRKLVEEAYKFGPEPGSRIV